VEPRTIRQAKVSAKGWIVIPVALRRRYGIKPGTIVNLEDRDGEIVVSLAQAAYRQARGMLSAEPSLTADLLAERASEVDREESKIRA
jgi:AbrB family looped-hinge helix DNA binding protein